MKTIATLLIVAAAATAHAQGTAARPAARASRPDLTGIWQALNTASWNIQDHSAEKGVPAGQGVVEGNDIPYTPAGLVRRADNAAHRETADPEASCYMPGVPRAMYMPFPFQILQSDNFVTMVFEYAMTVRRIYVDGSTHPEGIPTSWMGDSRGRWEGRTLIVDTTGFNGQSWFDRAGNPQSESTHVVERFTLRGRDHLDYEVTVNDPALYTRPWTMRMPLYRRLETQVQLLEYPCVSFLEDEYVRSRRKP
jgi:hypothetical protein